MKKLGLMVLLVGTALLCNRPIFAQDPHAQEILKEARTAIGGEELLQKIQSLGINGQYRRILGEREMAGDREVSIMLPDKYLVEDGFNMGGMSTSMISTRGLNGEHAWNGQSGGGGGMFIKMTTPGGQQATPEQIEAMFRRQYSLEFTRYLLAILVMPPPSLAVEYKYAGESDVEDAHADVMEVTGPDKLAVRLFFDKQTHVPLLLSYRGIKPRMVTVFNRTRRQEHKTRGRNQEGPGRCSEENNCGANAEAGRGRLFHPSYRLQESQRTVAPA